jgi:Ran GTPase-activating protein (RanGAP) involved in mRNA processing and transport
LYGNKSLQTLVLNDNPLNDEGVNMIAKGLTKNQTLRALNISKTNFGDTAGVHLASTFTHNKIELLRLSYTGISDDTMIPLFNAILENPILSSLSALECQIGNESMKNLANCLELNRVPLQHLFLQNNHITEEGIAIVSKSLKTNTLLREAHLGTTQRVTDSFRNALDKRIIF